MNIIMVVLAKKAGNLDVRFQWSLLYLQSGLQYDEPLTLNVPSIATTDSE